MISVKILTLILSTLFVSISSQEGLLFRVHGKRYMVMDKCYRYSMEKKYIMYSLDEKKNELSFKECNDKECSDCPVAFTSSFEINKFMPFPGVVFADNNYFSSRVLSIGNPQKLTPTSFGVVSFTDADACENKDMSKVWNIIYSEENHLKMNCWHLGSISPGFDSSSLRCICDEDSNELKCKRYNETGDCTGTFNWEDSSCQQSNSQQLCGNIDISQVSLNGVMMDISAELYYEAGETVNKKEEKCYSTEVKENLLEILKCDEDCKHHCLGYHINYEIGKDVPIPGSADIFILKNHLQLGTQFYAYGFNPLKMEPGEKNDQGNFDIQFQGSDMSEEYRYAVPEFDICVKKSLFECSSDGVLTIVSYSYENCTGLIGREIRKETVCGNLEQNNLDVEPYGSMYLTFITAFIVIGVIANCLVICGFLLYLAAVALVAVLVLVYIFRKILLVKKNLSVNDKKSDVKYSELQDQEEEELQDNMDSVEEIGNIQGINEELDDEKENEEIVKLKEIVTEL